MQKSRTRRASLPCTFFPWPLSAQLPTARVWLGLDPDGRQSRPGAAKGGNAASATFALLGKLIWVHIRTPSPTSCVHGGKLRFLICEPGLITGKWSHVPQCTAQRTCFPQTCYYFYYYFYSDDQHYRSSSFSLSVYPPKTLKDLGLI